MSGFVAELRDNAEAFVRRRKIDALCTDEDKVAPAHLLDELAKEMRFMSPDQVDDCAEYLSKRCESKSLVVKSKALRAIKTFCVKAPATFRQKMARHSVVVRACASHTGAPHPLRGDAPHKQVRDLAHEAVRAIFDARRDDAPSGDVGRPLFGHPLGTSSSSPNPNEAGAPIIGDARLSSEGGPRLRKTTGTWGGEERREGFGLRDAYANGNGNVRVTVRSDREESASSASDPERFRRASAPSSDAFVASASVSSASSARAAKNVFRLEGSEEGRRVDAACARGGVKLAPSAEVLKEFTRACEGLRPEGVAAALAAKFAAVRSLGALEGAPDAEKADARQEAFKAACCLEACALSEGEGARSVARRFLSNSNAANEEAESLRALAEGAGGGALAEKAKKAAAAAATAGGGGIPDAASVSATVPAAATARNRATSSEVDFFGLGDLVTDTSASLGASIPPVPVPVPVPVPAASPAVDDLLGGLSLGGATAPTPARFSPPQIPPAFAQQQMMQQQMMQQQMMQQQMMQQQMMQQQMMMSRARMSSMSSPPNVAAASPTTSSSRNAPAAPGGQSAKNYAKDAKAFDFVSDLLGSEKKK